MRSVLLSLLLAPMLFISGCSLMNDFGDFSFSQTNGDAGPGGSDSGDGDSGMATGGDGGGTGGLGDGGIDSGPEPDPLCDAAGCSEVGSTCDATTGVAVCSCLDGYFDMKGDGTECVDLNECRAGTAMCQDDSTCENKGGGYNCNCNQGFVYNKANKTCIDECVVLLSTTCADEALCSKPEGVGVCRCPFGFKDTSVKQDGSECTADDTCAALTCDTLAICDKVAGTPTCLCPDGYNDVNGDGSQCVDIDECALNTDSCDANAACGNTAGGHVCTCTDGWEGDGKTCANINECTDTTNLHDCSADAACTDTPGSFTCKCDKGYSGDGKVCTDDNECTLGTAVCSTNATCANAPAGSYSCECKKGFTGDGKVCDNIDECAMNLDDCKANEQCNDSPGSWTCGTCPTGSTKVGGVCTDINECTQDLDNCSANANCTNVDVIATTSAVGFTCLCKGGYAGDGVACTDVNECLTNNGGCSADAICTNVTGGARTCACKDGYSGNGLTCADKNECTLGTDTRCDHDREQCNNTPGDYTCSCKSGYNDPGTGCQDIDECASGTDNCDSSPDACVNTVGGFNCACPSGYTGTGVGDTCIDTNECALNTDSCDSSPDACVDTTGGFTCTCPSGYSGTGQGVNGCLDVCGNGIKTANEQCDDRNAVANDGCSSSCQIETGFTCPTVNAACVPKCGDKLVRSNSTYTEQCDDDDNTYPSAPASGDGCSSTCQIETGFACPTAGAACASVCGDGILKGSETCDDHNAIAGDGCSATCQVETGFTCPTVNAACVPKCGDRLVRSNSTYTEQCDDDDNTYPGAPAGGDGCSSTCQVEAGWSCATPGAACSPICGDKLKRGGEQCDDNDGTVPPTSGDGCSSTCTLETGWTCATEGVACTTTCGDKLKRGSEGCDDDDGTVPPTSGDGCSSTCVVEAGFTCGAEGTPCATVCGDGLLRGSETCDDHNVIAGDGCSATCQVELGFTCPTVNAACVPKCGDKLVRSNSTYTEQCDDDDNTWPAAPASGDGCSSTCQNESGFTCATPGLACTTTCGDKLKRGTEQCDDDDGTVPPQSGDGCSNICAIESGYTCGAEGVACVDKDECTNGTEQCDDLPVATCNNTPGSYRCSCPVGYTGTGVGQTGCCTPDGNTDGPNALPNDGRDNECDGLIDRPVIDVAATYPEAGAAVAGSDVSIVVIAATTNPTIGAATLLCRTYKRSDAEPKFAVCASNPIRPFTAAASALPANSGAWRTELRWAYASGAVSHITGFDYYVHSSLHGAPRCPGKIDGPEISDVTWFDKAAERLADPDAGVFKPGSDSVVANPFIRITYNPPPSARFGVGAGPIMKDMRSLRRRFKFGTNSKGIPNSYLLVTRNYASTKNNGSCNVVDLRVHVTTGITGDWIPRKMDPTWPSATASEHQNYACEALVLNRAGAGVCLGRDPRSLGGGVIFLRTNNDPVANKLGWAGAKQFMWRQLAHPSNFSADELVLPDEMQFKLP